MHYQSPASILAFLFLAIFAPTFEYGVPMPTARQEVQPALWQDKIVVIGGFKGPMIVSNAVEAYDIKNDSWEALPDYPELYHHVASASVDQTLFGFGGFSGGHFREWTPNANSFAYRNGKWEEIAPLPTARGEQLAATVNGKIYVIGGTNGRGVNTTVNEMYDPATNTWSKKRPMPTNRTSTGIAVIGDLIYVVGGRQFGTQGMKNMATLEAYDTKNDSWKSLPDMPSTSGGILATALNGKLYAMGGEVFSPQGSKAYSFLYSFDPKTNSWSKLDDMPAPRHGSGGVAANGKIFVVGGADKPAFGETDKTLIITP